MRNRMKIMENKKVELIVAQFQQVREELMTMEEFKSWLALQLEPEITQYTPLGWALNQTEEQIIIDSQNFEQKSCSECVEKILKGFNFKKGELCPHYPKVKGRGCARPITDCPPGYDNTCRKKIIF